jgi:uncharacterized protein YheU (UPF0270 family)
MKASTFSDVQEAFILRQGSDAVTVEANLRNRA